MVLPSTTRVCLCIYSIRRVKLMTMIPIEIFSMFWLKELYTWADSGPCHVSFSVHLSCETVSEKLKEWRVEKDADAPFIPLPVATHWRKSGGEGVKGGLTGASTSHCLPQMVFSRCLITSFLLKDRLYGHVELDENMNCWFDFHRKDQYSLFYHCNLCW